MRKKILLVTLGFVCACSAFLYAADNGKNSFWKDWSWINPFGKAYDYNDILVTYVVDGDTLRLEDGERVRLIGIDTPEVHESAKLYRDSQRTGTDTKMIIRLGKKASSFTRNLVEGKRVKLEFDVEKRDKYNRLLAYVYLPDGTLVNAKIVEEGYASLMTIPPNVKYSNLFLSLYREARLKKKGLWRD